VLFMSVSLCITHTHIYNPIYTHIHRDWCWTTGPATRACPSAWRTSLCSPATPPWNTRRRKYTHTYIYILCVVFSCVVCCLLPCCCELSVLCVLCVLCVCCCYYLSVVCCCVCCMCCVSCVVSLVSIVCVSCLLLCVCVVCPHMEYIYIHTHIHTYIQTTGRSTPT